MFEKNFNDKVDKENYNFPSHAKRFLFFNATPTTGSQNKNSDKKFRETNGDETSPVRTNNAMPYHQQRQTFNVNESVVNPSFFQFQIIFLNK